jgi:hypothetical protein
MHDGLAAIPLSLMTAQRVTNCYDLMDAAYCGSVLREHSRSLGHVPLIDHNPRRGEKIEFTPSKAQRYNEHSQAERDACAPDVRHAGVDCGSDPQVSEVSWAAGSKKSPKPA